MIHAEKEGTYTNLQGRVQRIHQAYSPKGQAVPDLEIFRRISMKLAPGADELRRAVPMFATEDAVVSDAV